MLKTSVNALDMRQLENSAALIQETKKFAYVSPE
jgi:hypothetical protein